MKTAQVLNADLVRGNTVLQLIHNVVDQDVSEASKAAVAEQQGRTASYLGRRCQSAPDRAFSEPLPSLEQGRSVGHESADLVGGNDGGRLPLGVQIPDRSLPLLPSPHLGRAWRPLRTPCCPAGRLVLRSGPNKSPLSARCAFSIATN